MVVERTQEFLSAADKFIAALPQDQSHELRSKLLLRPQAHPSPFSKAAATVAESIRSLKEFVRSNQHDYLSTGLISAVDKDRIEVEVGLVVQTCTKQIDRLKDSIVAAQKQQQQRQQQQNLAHQQPAGSGGDAPLPPALNPEQAACLHGMVLILAERLHGVSSNFDRCRAVRYRQIMEQQQPQPSLHQPHDKHKGRVSSNGVHPDQDASRGTGGSSSGAAQAQMLEENRFLAQHLEATSRGVHHIERSVRDIAALNQMFSTAVLHQAEAIEAIYSAAVDATLNISRGNESLTKAIAVNRSTQRYVLVLLLVATLGLLFMDWFNS